jgi:DegV family protein with EDD domain
MSVKIVTDSTSDLPKGLARELGITVVPLNVHFNLDTFQDGVDMQADQFYQRLLTSPVLPKTSAPAPGVFKQCYQALARESGEIVSIHISSKLSGTCEAALAARKDIDAACRIEVIDSKSVTMGLGLLVIAAARAAQKGASLEEVVALVRDSIGKVFVAGAPDTLEFLQKGGRLGKAQAWLGSILNIKPIISLENGEVVPLERVRTHTKAMARMYELMEERLPAESIALLYSTDGQAAQQLADRLQSAFPRQQVYLAQFGPVLGTYLGPNSLGVITLS